MEAWIAGIRWVHIVAGMVALFVAPVAMLTVKGGRAHRRWGKLYFWSMAVVALTAVILALRQPTLFLALLALFSFYMAYSGYRALYRKRPAQGEQATTADWVAAIITLGASTAMIVLGLATPVTVRGRLGVVPVVFGALGVVLAGNDLRTFVRPPADPNAWWFNHMGGMLGSYIATVSAFSVVNFTFLPVAVRWLWPTAVGVPAIVMWITYYRRRFRRSRRAAASGPA
jgi:uncharacterized membrane protein